MGCIVPYETIAVDGAGAVGRRGLMGLIPIGQRRRWVLSNAVDSDGASDVSCKRTLREISSEGKRNENETCAREYYLSLMSESWYIYARGQKLKVKGKYPSVVTEAFKAYSLYSTHNTVATVDCVRFIQAVWTNFQTRP